MKKPICIIRRTHKIGHFDSFPIRRIKSTQLPVNDTGNVDLLARDSLHDDVGLSQIYMGEDTTILGARVIFCRAIKLPQELDPLGLAVISLIWVREEEAFKVVRSPNLLGASAQMSPLVNASPSVAATPELAWR